MVYLLQLSHTQRKANIANKYWEMSYSIKNMCRDVGALGMELFALKNIFLKSNE